MRRLFEDLVRNGASAVRGLRGRSEELDFDCKRKANHGSGSLEREDKENLGITLSAFANSMGGLLLWGVEAKLDKSSGLDVVCDFYPIADLKRFATEVRTISSEAIMPRLSSVEVELIEEPAGSATGYLAMYVARSDRRPHRCEISGVKGYYRRSISSSRMMEHFEIEDAFKSFQVPNLEVIVSLYRQEQSEKAITIGIELSLKNVSNVSAFFPCVCVHRARPNYNWDSLRPIPGITPRTQDGSMYFEGSADFVINPNVIRDSC